jgi:hypothetical protein
MMTDARKLVANSHEGGANRRRTVAIAAACAEAA